MAIRLNEPLACPLHPKQAIYLLRLLPDLDLRLAALAALWPAIWDRDAVVDVVMALDQPTPLPNPGVKPKAGTGLLPELPAKAVAAGKAVVAAAEAAKVRAAAAAAAEAAKALAGEDSSSTLDSHPRDGSHTGQSHTGLLDAGRTSHTGQQGSTGGKGDAFNLGVPVSNSGSVAPTPGLGVPKKESPPLVAPRGWLAPGQTPPQPKPAEEEGKDKKGKKGKDKKSKDGSKAVSTAGNPTEAGPVEKVGPRDASIKLLRAAAAKLGWCALGLHWTAPGGFPGLSEMGCWWVAAQGSSPRERPSTHDSQLES